MAKLSTNPDRIDLDEAYIEMASIWARRSKAVRRQVGAILVKDRRILSDGYNGMPAGDDDDICEYVDPLTHELVTKPEVLHAESNALMKLAEGGGIGAEGATMYLTLSPCRECAKLIKQAKIKRVVYKDKYRDLGGVEFLEARGVQVEQWKK